MAVYLAAADEAITPGRDGVFVWGGYVASEVNWTRYFDVSWPDRVLGSSPRLPYFHTVELRSRTWREKHRVSYNEAERRIDEAVRIVRSAGYLHPFTSEVRKSHLREYLLAPLRDARVPMPRGARLPEYFSFLAFVAALTDRLPTIYPDVECINFLVEQSSSTKVLARIHERLPRNLPSGVSHLVGAFQPSGKTDARLQVTDLLCWHVRRAIEGTLEQVDERRLDHLVGREGLRHQWTPALLKELADNLIRRAAVEQAGLLAIRIAEETPKP